MNLHNPAHPSEIILEYYLSSPDFVVSAGKPKTLKNLIQNKIPITQEYAEILANIFQTSVDYWLNLQKQYDLAEKPEPLQDKSIVCDTLDLAFSSLSETGRPSNYQGTYLLSEQSYKYLISGRTQDEEWDLGWLGASEKYTISTKMPKALTDAIDKLKANKSVISVKEKLNTLTVKLLNK